MVGAGLIGTSLDFGEGVHCRRVAINDEGDDEDSNVATNVTTDGDGVAMDGNGGADGADGVIAVVKTRKRPTDPNWTPDGDGNNNTTGKKGRNAGNTPVVTDGKARARATKTNVQNVASNAMIALTTKATPPVPQSNVFQNATNNPQTRVTRSASTRAGAPTRPAQPSSDLPVFGDLKKTESYYSGRQEVMFSEPGQIDVGFIAPHMALLQQLTETPHLVINAGMFPHAVMAQVCLHAVACLCDAALSWVHA